jgi:hypothetical protein
MSAHTVHVLGCDAVPEGLDLCNNDILGLHWMDLDEARAYAARCGWRVDDERLVCPECVREGTP